MWDLLDHFNFTNLEDPSQMTLQAWSEWLNTDLTDRGEYWKGLEVFLFLVSAHGVGLEA
jgi:hypothetical protein